MSLAGTRVDMTHRCSILRDESADDAWGQPGGVFTSVEANVPCRAWTRAGREAVNQTEVVVVEDLRLAVPLGTDVTEEDRIGDVTQRGAVIHAGPMRIDTVLTYPDRLELLLTRIR